MLCVQVCRCPADIFLKRLTLETWARRKTLLATSSGRSVWNVAAMAGGGRQGLNDGLRRRLVRVENSRRSKGVREWMLVLNCAGMATEIERDRSCGVKGNALW